MYVVFRIDARAYGLKDFSVLFVFQTQGSKIQFTTLQVEILDEK